MGTKATDQPVQAPYKPVKRRALAARSSVADALFTGTRQRVLALLFGQPERSFYTKELIDLAGAGSGGVQRELARLQHSGLITQLQIGNQKHYRANADGPIFAELCGIVRKLLGPVEVLRETLAPLAGAVQLALLYGSVAARRDSALSDIDVLLVSDRLAMEQVYETLAPAEKRLGRRVSPTVYTPVEFRRRLAQGNPFLTRLLAGDTVPLVGNADEFVAAG